MLKRLVAVAALTVPVLVACASETGDDEELEDSEGSGSALLAGRQLEPAEVATLLREAGFAENQIGKMVCTAKYESTFYEGAQNNRNRNHSVDRGLFQINSIHLGSMRGCPTKAKAETLFDAATNVRCAKAIFDAQGNKAWYGYRSHRRECDQFVAPESATAAADTPEADAGLTGPR